MRGTIQEHMARTDELIKDSTWGSQSIPETSLIHEETSSLFSAISGEYTKLVQKYPEYDFSIVRDPLAGAINIYWNRKVDPE